MGLQERKLMQMLIDAYANHLNKPKGMRYNPYFRVLNTTYIPYLISFD